MKLDADDFISSKLIDWLKNASGEAGYLIEHGWFWRSGARHLIQCTENLDRVCASCIIIRSDFADKNGPFRTEMKGSVLMKQVQSSRQAILILSFLDLGSALSC
jgi:hypothetical protein